VAAKPIETKKERVVPNSRDVEGNILMMVQRR